MQPAAMAGALAALVVVLGGVTVNQIGATSPKEPTEDGEAYLWPTDKVYYNLKIQMTNGELWAVKPMPVINADGSITITLKRPTTQVFTTKITVGAADVHTRIWWAATEYVADPENGTTEPLPWVPPGEGIPDPVPTPGGPQPGEPTPTPDPGDGQLVIPGL